MGFVVCGWLACLRVLGVWCWGWLLWWLGVVGALLTNGVCEWLLWGCLFMVVGVACVLLCCSVVWVDLCCFLWSGFSWQVVCVGFWFCGFWLVQGGFGVLVLWLVACCGC